LLLLQLAVCSLQISRMYFLRGLSMLEWQTQLLLLPLLLVGNKM